MKVNKKLLPLKAHYFCFLGCVSPILPFVVVVGQHLGIPVSVMGIVMAVYYVMVVLMKPVVAALADTYPSYRRLIFLANLGVMVISFSSIYFVPPLKGLPRVQGRLVQPQNMSGPSPATPLVPLMEEDSLLGDGSGAGPSLLLAAPDNGGECYVAVAWDCVARCGEPWSCLNSTTTTTPTITVTLRSHDQDLHFRGGEAAPPFPSSPELGQEEQLGPHRVYMLEGTGVSDDLFPGNLSLECGSGKWKGPGCSGVWSHWQFWVFFLLLIIGQICFNVSISVTDAIIVDTIGEDGDYGIQRAWGTVGWGLMGLMSGLLVDLWSGTSVTKDYLPAFLLCLGLGSFDVLFSAATIKVPKMTTEHNVLKKVWPIVGQPCFFVFCIFVIFGGMFDGTVAMYIFTLQESMAKGTSTVKYLKLLQGLTVFVQCSVEAPFMFINKYFMDAVGPQYVLSLVFFLYTFRLLGLAMAGAYGPVWATLVVELLNGPCYGLGYTAIIIYASKLSPPGTSNTVQGFVSICYETVGYGTASLFGGLLLSSLGGPGMYLVMGSVSVAVFLLHVLSLKVLPPPDENSEEKKSIENEAEEELSPDPVAEGVHEGSPLAFKMEGEQECVPMT